MTLATRRHNSHKRHKRHKSHKRNQCHPSQYLTRVCGVTMAGPRV